jgi:hypothetical protein
VTGVMLVPAESSDFQMKQRKTDQEVVSIAAGPRSLRGSRGASILAKAGEGKSQCDREQAERSRLGESRANHWTPVPGRTILRRVNA